MQTLNRYDTIEKMIFILGLRITFVNTNKEEDKLNVLLNTGVELTFPITDYKLLSSGTNKQMANYELIADGVGIHWPELDEDLSLKGFIQKAMIQPETDSQPMF